MGYIKKNWFVILYAVILFLVFIFPESFKELFVGKGGNLKVHGYEIGGLLSILLLCRWKFTVLLFYVVFILVLLFDSFLTVFISQEFFLNYLILFLVHTSLFLVFAFSKKIKAYLRIEEQFKILNDFPEESLGEKS